MLVSYDDMKTYLKHPWETFKPPWVSFNIYLKHLLDTHDRDVRDQFLHVETETETQWTQPQFLMLRLRFSKLVSNFETETETL